MGEIGLCLFIYIFIYNMFTNISLFKNTSIKLVKIKDLYKGLLFLFYLHSPLSSIIKGGGDVLYNGN